MEGTTLFSYHPGDTLLHRMPPAAKVVLMLVLAVAAFYVPVIPAVAAWLSLIVLSVAWLGFSAREVRSDLAPVAAYCVMFYAFSLILNCVGLWQERAATQEPLAAKRLAMALVPAAQYVPLLAHLALSVEVSAVFYRTTSTVQFGTGFRDIERCITRRQDTPLADALSLTLTFIPRLAQFWRRIDTAWLARGGTTGIRRIRTLFPVLFRVSMAEAYAKALAQENRR